TIVPWWRRGGQRSCPSAPHLPAERNLPPGFVCCNALLGGGPDACPERRRPRLRGRAIESGRPSRRKAGRPEPGGRANRPVGWADVSQLALERAARPPTPGA